MLKRFLHAFLWFAGLVVPTAFALALLAAPAARPEPAISAWLRSQSSGRNGERSDHEGSGQKPRRHSWSRDLYRHAPLLS